MSLSKKNKRNIPVGQEIKQVTGNTALVSDNFIIDVQDYAWRKLPNESLTAYNYFKVYLSLPFPRNLLRASKQCRVVRQTLANYAGKYKWNDRATAYDAFLFEKQTEQKRVVLEAKEIEWLERRNLQREDEWNIAQALLDKVREMLCVPIMRQTITEMLEDIDSDGKIIIKQIIVNEPLDWKVVDIARFFEVASKMARLATGLETDRKTIKIDVTKMTDEELEQLVNE